MTFANKANNSPDNWSTTVSSGNKPRENKKEEDDDEPSEVEQWIQEHQRYDNSGFAKKTGLEFYGGHYHHYPDKYDEISLGVKRGQFPKGLVTRLDRVALRIPVEHGPTFHIDFYRADPTYMGRMDQPPTYKKLQDDNEDMKETLEEIAESQAWVPSDTYDSLECSDCNAPREFNFEDEDITDHDDDCLFEKARQQLKEVKQ